MDLDEQVVRADLGLGHLDIEQAVGVIGREVPVVANRGDSVLADLHDAAPSFLLLTVIPAWHVMSSTQRFQ